MQQLINKGVHCRYVLGPIIYNDLANYSTCKHKLHTSSATLTPALLVEYTVIWHKCEREWQHCKWILSISAHITISNKFVQVTRSFSAFPGYEIPICMFFNQSLLPKIIIQPITWRSGSRDGDQNSRTYSEESCKIYNSLMKLKAIDSANTKFWNLRNSIIRFSYFGKLYSHATALLHHNRRHPKAITPYGLVPTTISTFGHHYSYVVVSTQDVLKWSLDEQHKLAKKTNRKMNTWQETSKNVGRTGSTATCGLKKQFLKSQLPWDKPFWRMLTEQQSGHLSTHK